MRIRRRLLATHLALVVLVIGGMEVAMRAVIRDRVENLLATDLAHAAAITGESITATGEGTTPEALAATVRRLSSAADARVTVISAVGRVIADSEIAMEDLSSLENHDDRPEVIAARAGGRAGATRWSATLQQRMTYAAAALPDGRVVRLAKPAEQVKRAATHVSTAVALAGLVALIAAGAVSSAVSAALARPIQELTETARTMAAGTLEHRADARRHRADARRKDELGDLARALEHLGVSFSRTIREVTAERNRIAGVLAGMVEGVLVVDADGRIVMVNPSLTEILALHGDPAGLTVLEAVRSAALHESIEDVLGGREPAGRMLTLHGPPERTMAVRFSILRGGEDGAAISGLVAVFHDVTELRRLEQVRRDFVANASHELKTPVAAILGASETLVEGAARDPEAAPRFLESIQRNASRLAALVDDLLDLSRMEAKGPLETPRAVQPAEALARAASLFKDSAEAKRIRLECEPAGTLPAARGESALLDRALLNLVQNAVRYTPEGGRVVLRAVHAGEHIRFEVEDTGIGIPPLALPRIFERFYRVDPARSRALGGTGLGLAIVKHAVESMGGTVSVRSTPGRGSTFAFFLPVWTGE